MCGIYGCLKLHGPSPDPGLLTRMGEAVVHRGPDSEGRYIGEGLALGMRRLKIIDLAGGDQPIPNEDETVWVVCNGEIYNFQQLRQELEPRHRFRTRSDTEVIVHLYEEHGAGFVRHLRGMFAIALWDVRRRRLLLARDRLGKKPLYIRREQDRILFASEIKSLLAAGEAPLRVDSTSLRKYLALGYVPAPRTLFAGVEKLLPAHCLEIEDGQVTDSEYWQVGFDAVEERSEDEWVEQVRSKFLEAVELRLISDVPLGAFLSGGIDSSAVVAAMSRFSDRPVKTFSIGFGEQDKLYNELPYARLVAQAFKTDHHEIIVRPNVAELLPRLIWHLDEPMADSAFVTTYLIARLARETVTVVLSGVGGDELFGGYRRYLGDEMTRYYRWLPRPLRKSISAVLAQLPQDRHSRWANQLRYAAAFTRSAEQSAAARYISYLTVFSPEVRRLMLLDGHAEEEDLREFEQYFAACQAADSLQANMFVDWKTSLPDDLLLLTDKMTMAASVECRAPFMDQELLELTARIPSRLKIRGLSMKYLLKKVVQPWLPQEILHRNKRGFGAPMGAWIRQELEPLLQDTLSEKQIRARGLFSWPAVQSMIAEHRARQRDYTDNLLALINLELWCRIFLDGDDWETVTERQLAALQA